MVPAKDFILQRFLNNTEAYAETVCEQTTVAYAEDGEETGYFQLAPTELSRNDSSAPSEPLLSPGSPTQVSVLSTGSQESRLLSKVGSLYSTSSGGTPTVETQAGYRPHNWPSTVNADPPEPSSSLSKVKSHAMNDANEPGAVEGYKLVQTVSGHTDSVYGLAFSADGKRPATSSWDATIIIWDAFSGVVMQTLTGHSIMVYGVAFSPNGQKIASGSADHTVRLWDGFSGWPLQTLNGHGNSVSSVAFSPDSRRLASSSVDETIRLWDAVTGAALKTLKGHTGGIWSVAFSPNGRWLASGSRDRSVKALGRGNGGPPVDNQ
jgi:WD40 repeat protein